MNSDQQRQLLSILRSTPPEQSADYLNKAQALAGDNFTKLAASALVTLAQPAQALPGELSRFGSMLCDGIEFFLTNLSMERLQGAIVAQAQLSENTPSGERLYQLARQFPTLHKLAQIVARQPGLAEELKCWLRQLETMDFEGDPEPLVDVLRTEMAAHHPALVIDFIPEVVAVASVAAVVPFIWEKPGAKKSLTGVCKVLKVSIGDSLAEELRVLTETAQFIETHKERYGLRQMQVTTLFEEVKTEMAREINLTAEQLHLKKAAALYAGVEGVRIPELFSFSTPAVTTMEFLPGGRITAAKLSRQKRSRLARLAFEAIVCRPLFSQEQQPLFHGDPHAGNIIAIANEDPEALEIGLIDWTLAGHLSRTERSELMAMMVAIVTLDKRALAAAIHSLAARAGEPPDYKWLQSEVGQLLRNERFFPQEPLQTAFWMVAELTLDGLVLPSELLLFRKAYYTLEGVLVELSPEFSPARAMESYLERLLLAETPKRLATGWPLRQDMGHEYQSLLSTEMVVALGLARSLVAWQQSFEKASNLAMAQTLAMAEFFSSWWRSWHAPRT